MRAARRRPDTWFAPDRAEITTNSPPCTAGVVHTWFHIAMRLRPLEQMMLGLASRDFRDPRPACSARASIERARHLLWHGRSGKANEELIRFMNHAADITLRNGDQHLATTTDLRRLCADLRGYVLNNYDAIVSYHHRYHADRPVSTSRAEGCVDEIANARMSKRRRMRWSPRGAHDVAVVRAAVLDGRLKPPIYEREAA